MSPSAFGKPPLSRGQGPVRVGEREAISPERGVSEAFVHLPKKRESFRPNRSFPEGFLVGFLRLRGAFLEVEMREAWMASLESQGSAEGEEMAG